jgi:hypothetical protein
MANLTNRICLLFVSCATALAVHATTNPPNSLQHDVLLDGKPIGFHRFTIHDTGSGLRVDGHAKFVVKLLGLKVFDYDHRISEQWRGACLERLDAVTQQNGQTSRVEGYSSSRIFTVRKDAASEPLSECVASFAYWDKTRLLERTALLNPQTGEYVPVTIENLGVQRERAGSGQSTVERYRILGRQIDITVSYDQPTGQWLTLESRLENGRSLQYRLRRAEMATPTSALGAM